jgi:uncharacterized protein YjcR
MSTPRKDPPPDIVTVYATNLYSTEQVAKLLAVSPGTIRAWRARRKGPPYITVSRTLVRYRGKELLEWMDNIGSEG